MSGFAFDPQTGDIYPGITGNDVPFLPNGMQVGGFQSALNVPGYDTANAQSQIAPSSSWLSGLANRFPNAGGNLFSQFAKADPSAPLTTPEKNTSTSSSSSSGFFSWLSISRLTTLFVGLLVFAAGVFLLGKGAPTIEIKK